MTLDELQALTEPPKRDALSLLKAGRDTLASGGPKAWTKGTFARTAPTAKANRTEPWSPQATCWCAVGAIYKAWGSWHLAGPPNQAWGALDSAAAQAKADPPFTSAQQLNDTPGTRFPDIIALYDRAISALEQEGTTP